MNKYICGSLVVLAALMAFCICSLPDGRLHVFMLDVGQGDAFLFRTPAGAYILVDGGPNDAVIQELSAVMPFYEHTIDTVILTHPHPDHVNGLVEVLKRYRVRQVILTGISYDYPGYSAFLEELERGRAQVIFADGRDYRTGGDKSGRSAVVFDFLFPFESIQGQSFVNANNSSIVFRLIYGNNMIYFSGDCELECEAAIIESGQDLRADVLKVGHHGSRTSSSEAMLDSVGAGTALIPVGEGNSYKHPHGETVKKLQERGVKILRTDIDGRVEVVSDGIKIKTP
jgi:competence protein ComEC